jgi:hypothetical protein
MNMHTELACSTLIGCATWHTSNQWRSTRYDALQRSYGGLICQNNVRLDRLLQSRSLRHATCQDRSSPRTKDHSQGSVIDCLVRVRPKVEYNWRQTQHCWTTLRHEYTDHGFVRIHVERISNQAGCNPRGRYRRVLKRSRDIGACSAETGQAIEAIGSPKWAKVGTRLRCFQWRERPRLTLPRRQLQSRCRSRSENKSARSCAGRVVAAYQLVRLVVARDPIRARPSGAQRAKS